MFLLNTRLAEAESMTHDVIRDLVGVKKDLTSFTVHTPINFISACMLISIEFYTWFTDFTSVWNSQCWANSRSSSLLRLQRIKHLK